MQEGLVITTDKEKIMDDAKVDEVVSEVNDMKSFKVCVCRTRVYLTEVIINAEDEETVFDGYWDVTYDEIDEKDWNYYSTEIELIEMDELDQDETELPRFTITKQNNG